MGLSPTAGAKLYIADPGPISPTPTYDMIDEVVNYGEFGRVYTKIAFESVNNRKVRKFKGNFDDGAFELQLGRNPQDAGQAKLIVALDDDELYNFKLELNDAPDGGEPTTFTFKAMVMSYKTNLGQANSVVGATTTLEIESDTIDEVAAHA